MLPAQVHALEVKRRLRAPIGGKRSSELEVISVAQQRREAWEVLRREREADDETKHQQRLAAIAAETRRIRNEFLESEMAWAARMNARGIQVSAIIDACCAKYGVKPLEILSHRREMPVVFVRQVVAYLCTEVTTKSLPEIGRFLNGRDHTTIMHARNKIRALVASSPDFAAQMDALKKQLGAG